MFLPILLIGLQGPSHLQTSAPAQHTSQLPTESKDLSDHLGLLLAASVAAGAHSDQHRASVFGGIKIGMPVALKGRFGKGGSSRLRSQRERRYAPGGRATKVAACVLQDRRRSR